MLRRLRATRATRAVSSVSKPATAVSYNVRVSVLARRHDPAQPVRRLQQLFRLGRAGGQPTPAGSPGRGIAGDRADRLLHRRQRRSQDLRREDRQPGARCQAPLPRHRDRGSAAIVVRGLASAPDGGDRARDSDRRGAFGGRGRLRVDRPPVSARERDRGGAAGQARSRGGSAQRRDPLFRRHRAQPLAGQDRHRHAEARRTGGDRTQGPAGHPAPADADRSVRHQRVDALATVRGVVPKRYQNLAVSPLEKYFAAARGHQSEAGDVKALAMKKWFNTNYHYMVPEFDDGTVLKLDLSKLLSEYQEALALGITTKPVLIGPYTLIKLIKFTGQSSIATIQDEVVAIYAEVFEKLAAEKIDWLQLDEPALVFDLSAEDIGLVKAIYTPLLAQKKSVKVLLQTYFGDVRDIYTDLVKLDVDGIGLDFVEGRKTAELIATHGFPTDKKLFAGVVNGKNIWRNNYQKTLDILAKLPKDKLVISSSCSLQHVPYTVSAETDLDEKILRHFAFAQEKLQEIKDINAIFYQLETGSLAENKALFDEKRFEADLTVQEKVSSLSARSEEHTSELQSPL